MEEPKFHYHKDLPKITPTKQKFLSEQVERIKKMPQPEQKSQDWYDFRDQRITASDFGAALNMDHGYDYNVLKKKVVLDRKFITSAAILHGIKYEDVAISIYEHRNKVVVREYGCIAHPVHNFLGASPDGITDDGIMVEIKCPSSREITGVTPLGYWCQVQGQLEVCELDRCDFLECKIVEYDSRDEYLADNYEGDYFYNSLGMEKGAVVEFFDKEKKKQFYSYMPIGMSGEEIDAFAAKEEAKYANDPNVIYCGIDYWRLERVSCVPIYRNQEWWHNVALPKLTQLWNDIVRFRIEGIDAMNDHIIRIKEERKQRKLAEKVVKKMRGKKPKKKVMIPTTIHDFVGLKGNETEDQIDKLLNGEFIIMDGEKIDISDCEIFGNRNTKTSKSKVIDNSMVLDSGKFSFSNKKFYKEEKKDKKNDYGEVFSNTRRTRQPLKLPTVDDCMDDENEDDIDFDSMVTFKNTPALKDKRLGDHILKKKKEFDYNKIPSFKNSRKSTFKQASKLEVFGNNRPKKIKIVKNKEEKVISQGKKTKQIKIKREKKVVETIDLSSLF